MDPVLAVAAVLVFGLAAAGYGLSRRLEQIRQRLETLDKVQVLEQRLDQLISQVERREFSAALSAKLTEFAEAHARLAASVAELRQAHVERPARAEAPATDPAGVVHAHLRRLGFEDVHLLTELETLSDDSGRVVFEARRRGVQHKGHLELQDGKIVHESIQSAYSTFP
ncbi:MAG: hypothetical protein ACYTG2_13040 [Planctomycetota bacterium]|jgi:hypothetical protein